MKARNYNKPIAIWQTSDVPDGFGGITKSTSLVRSVWAYVTTRNAQRLNENGQNDNLTKTVFIIRYNANLPINVKTYFIKYKGLIYDIDGIVNAGVNDIDLEITATQRT